MKRPCYLSLLLPVLLTGLPVMAPAAAILFNNPGFEQNGDSIPGTLNPGTPIASDPGDYTSGPAGGVAAGGEPIPSWGNPLAIPASAGLFNPTGSTTGSAHSGSLTAFSGVNGTISQKLNLGDGVMATATPGAVITISGWFSNRNSNASQNLRVSLRVEPNVDVLTPVLIDPPNSPAWTAWTASFTLPDAATLGASNGLPLFMVMQSTAAQVLLDDISGTYTAAVPEPGAAALGALSGLMLLNRRHRLPSGLIRLPRLSASHLLTSTFDTPCSSHRGSFSPLSAA